MSIRSLIAIENADNTIEAIYCHWGGAPANNGRILHEHFSNSEKLRELIALGNISELHSRLHPIGKHSFDKKEQGTTVAHHRDKGDAWESTQPKTFASLRKFLKNPGYWNVEHIYVFTKNGEWTLYSQEDSKTFQVERDLVTTLKKEKP
jgi:hypothetical protein